MIRMIYKLEKRINSVSGYITNVEKLYDFEPFVIKTGIPVEDIDDFYVPFDEMQNHPTIEERLVAEFKKHNLEKFFGVMGKSGSGKTSILNYLLNRFSKNNSEVFCIKLNNFSDIQTPQDLLKNIIKTIFHMSSQFLDLSEDQKLEAKKVSSGKYSLAERKERGKRLGIRPWFNVIPFIAGIDGQVAMDLRTQTSVEITESSSISDMLTFLNQTISILHEKAHMRHVVIMIDETDKIRSSDETKSAVDSAMQFFNTNLPVLEKTNCSYVFVMNDQYDTDVFREKILDKFSPLLRVPSISTESSLQQIIEKRTRAACGNINYDDVWEKFSINSLFQYYKEHSLRTLMPICSLSVQKARSEGSETISIGHIQNAILEMTS